MTTTKMRPEPYFISREDRPIGKWTVEECAPRRGLPRTNNVDRIIVTPMGNTPLERVIRAHELMHSKISPADDWQSWVERGIASKESMIAVEEIRVNYGLKLAGFDLDYLTDGAEDADGEFVAIHADWVNALRFAVGSAGTGGGKKFITGVRRHNKLWATALSQIQKRILREIKKDTRKNTRVVFGTHEYLGLAPSGFQWTERMAEYVDRLSRSTPEEELSKGETDSDGDKTIDGEVGSASIGKQEVSTTPDKPVKKIIFDMEPLARRSGQNGDDWTELVFGACPLSRTVGGYLGRKRISSNVGRNPRRIHRLYTDPCRRVFDKTTRTSGGVVLIDGSGSMSLAHSEVISILASAPGALVAIYSEMSEGQPNMFIIAKNGKTVLNEDALPKVGNGNGVDFPALQWAINQRKNSKVPVIWVTDGGVCGKKGTFNHLLALACINKVIQNKVLVVENATEAVGALKKLNTRQTITRRWPHYFQAVIEETGLSKAQLVDAK